MNYFEIVRSYNEFLIAKQVGAKANSLFYALIGKSNILRFPTKLTIYNSELRDLSGLSKDELNPARNKLMQVHVNDQYLVKYKSRGTRKPGDYWINYEGLTNFFQNEPSSDWSCIQIKDKPINPSKEDYSDNPLNSGANPNTNHGSNDGVNGQRLVGKSDSLLTDLNKQNITNRTAAVSKSNFFDSYMLCFGKQPTPLLAEEITDYIDNDGLSEELVCLAFEKASKNGKGYPYARSILNSWVDKGIRTVYQAEEEQKKFQQRRLRQAGSNVHQEIQPEWMDNPQPDKPREVTEEDRQRAAELDKYLSGI
ncbi:DnaD domain-containing protein [Sporolactobacillus pectinivorans]|uniref:DnaD domain-containing protein n=1 Tax=Sporolactobacillus pectinivorans TaxID=1591408 RepID=UPI0012FDEB39|nr:DnaD domain protein [Sporolactobacillus pectinivorans]